MARLDDGHPTTIEFAILPGLLLYEKEVTPPGVSGGGENDTTTMLNTVYRTRAPKKLITLTPASATCAYDPLAFSAAQIMALINILTLITITYPDGVTTVFYGWLDEVTPGAIVEGSQPTVDITIIPANQNSSGTETAPVTS